GGGGEGGRGGGGGAEAGVGGEGDDGGGDGGGGPVERGQLVGLIRDLAGRLNEGNYETQEVVEALQAAMTTAAQRLILGKVTRQVERYEFEKAVETLGHLAAKLGIAEEEYT
ncbi:MAG: hypothetical protein HQL59_13475, partial [Magnetococcales bacterium]|nr:hypothetical protein [Magnetococcales bacterium]